MPGRTNSPIDENYKKGVGGESTIDGSFVPIYADPATKRLYVDANVSSSPLPSGAATSSKQDDLLAELQLKADLTETQPVQEVEPTGINGGQVTVGTSEIEMTFTGTTRSIMIQSDTDNTGYIWVGLTGVTNSGGNAFAQLNPGQSVSIDFNDTTNAIYAISDVADQTVYKMGLT